MLILLFLLLLLCYVYIRYTELKNKDLTVNDKMCDTIGELVALMIFADGKREFKEYEVATGALNHRFKISVSDKVKTSVLDYYQKQAGIDLNPDHLEQTRTRIADITQPLNSLSATDCIAIMEVLCCVAKVSGFKKKEWVLFQLIGEQLKIGQKDMERYRLFFEPHILNTASDEDFATLGLSSDASVDDVKESYTMLLHKYLTDGIADETLKLVLEEKRKEVDAAYQRVMDEMVR